MITINGNAKINLTLDVLDKRADGYHEVSMVMQSIELHDVLTVEKLNTKGEIILCGDVKGVAKPQDNLAYKAVDLFLRTYDIDCSVKITLEKNIPVAAGLAGGSTDAGAVLRGLNRLFEMNLSNEELCQMGAKLGSDIPFCIVGGTMLAEGRGEILSSLPEMVESDLILVKPKLEVSTAWVYKNYDKTPAKEHPDNEMMKKALKDKDIEGICYNMGNVLEAVTIPAYPEIESIKEKLCAYGAKRAMMSGSGPTVFALVEDEIVAKEIVEKIKLEFDADVFVTKTVGANR